VDEGSIATYADALNNLLTPLGKFTSNRTEFGLSTNSRTALPEADENTVAAYLEQRTSGANRIASRSTQTTPSCQKRPLLHVTQTARSRDLHQHLTSKRGSLMPNMAPSRLMKALTTLQKPLPSK
jgi:hypothetical protein